MTYEWMMIGSTAWVLLSHPLEVCREEFSESKSKVMQFLARRKFERGRERAWQSRRSENGYEFDALAPVDRIHFVYGHHHDYHD